MEDSSETVGGGVVSVRPLTRQLCWVDRQRLRWFAEQSLVDRVLCLQPGPRMSISCDRGKELLIGGYSIMNGKGDRILLVDLGPI